ncbi:putative ribosomal protein L25/L23 [Helianthus annuus]|uniref:Ribosomal protein L25/L23 n=1 Tax=Helianthus annuus TaxID=4232 RepID=A0A9K3MY82_HELAN|nr:putative ribosomal protein L25/L23 [Helianthus annuus]KAJ0515888.1 putative ribosomal protein L25/L23 [Helianthus annuus]KAJ0515890.1 putative ribosomal protein L25/L23 [Helianthus annuus]KAJ0630440.1 putative ribosomal protein L25/L23 [Helianthus annuus]KAJ0630442.1 putative ribosomal protein L25/L23 [Helianthus annuus]
MAVVFSCSNMITQLRNHHPPSVKTVAFSKGVFVNPINFKIPSSFTRNSSSFAIKAYQNQSDQSPTEVQPKRSTATPTNPEVDNFKEPEEEPQSLKLAKAKAKAATALQTSMDYQQVLKYPLVTEAAIQSIIKENTLVFMVDVRANKKDIRNAFENMLKIKTKKINTLINYDGTKKAYIQLPPENQAATIAKRLKILA